MRGYMVMNPGWVGRWTFMRVVYIIMNFHMQSSVLRSDMMATAGRRKVHDENIELKENPFDLGVSESASDRDVLTP